jgi:hypothetical protein
MRAMLKAVKIDSYPCSSTRATRPTCARSGPRRMQFNHCIIAVKRRRRDEGRHGRRAPALGRLLIFDATDDNTPVGDLPDHEQGSFALIAAGESARSAHARTPPEANIALSARPRSPRGRRLDSRPRARAHRRAVGGSGARASSRTGSRGDYDRGHTSVGPGARRRARSSRKHRARRRARRRALRARRRVHAARLRAVNAGQAARLQAGGRRPRPTRAGWPSRRASSPS